MKKEKKSILRSKGINAFFLNTSLSILIAALFCFIFFLSFKIQKKFSRVQDAINKFIVSEDCSKEIKEHSNYLTEQARMFVITQNTSYADSYISEAFQSRRQDEIISRMKQICSEKDMELQRLTIALSQAESLKEMELYAIRLGYESIKKQQKNPSAFRLPEEILNIDIKNNDAGLSAEEIHKLSVNNLFNDGYLLYKTRINENCNTIISNISNSIAKDLKINANNLGDTLQLLSIHLMMLLLIVIIIFISMIILILRPLRKFQISIKKDKKLNIIGSSEFRKLAHAYNEIHEIKAIKEKNLLFNAEYDALTGILNRRAFDQICKETAENKQPIALLLIDMDNFKYINDTFGHSGGDTALKELAHHLKNAFRNGDYITRIGGDEFAVILMNFKITSKELIIKKINNINEKLSNCRDGIKPVSVSAGCAFSSEGFTKELYKNADKALYSVKENGRRGCSIFEQ